MIEREAGLITQHIGASTVPIETISRICGKLIDQSKSKMNLPGLLFIDTPGHAAFSSLRKRGGSLADIAILVVDINEGFMPQTIESVKILMEQKTPFIIAANKIDLVPGSTKTEGGILQEISKQSENTQKIIQNKIYEIVGSLSKFNIQSERFDRLDDYTKQIAIIPTSAKTGEGMAELLMVLTGLTQKYLSENLECDKSSQAKGTVLEVKEEKGLGTTLDVIIYDGCLKKGDSIVIGGIDKPIITKVKALLEPAPLSEIRDKKSKFKQSQQVYAAVGVKISAVDIEDVIAGMPIRSCTKQDIKKVSQEIQKEVSEVVIETEKEGVIVKSDALGSLEALSKLLKDEGIVIRKAGIGNISKNDIASAESSFEKDPINSAILGFNVQLQEGVSSKKINIFTNDVIYRLIEEFKKWQIQKKKNLEMQQLEGITMPAKFEILTGYVFRQNNPAIVGVDILSGEIKTGMHVMNAQGKTISEIKAIQHEQDSITKAEKGKQVAVSLPNVTVGRQIHEGDILYSAIIESEFRKLKDLKKLLTPQDIEVLKEIAEIKRKDNPVWGI